MLKAAVSKGGVFGHLGVFGSNSGCNGGSGDVRNDVVGYDGCRSGDVSHDGKVRELIGLWMMETGL